MPLENLLRLADEAQPTKELDDLIIRQCPSIPAYASTLETRKAELIAQNRNYAELNLSKEPRLNEGFFILFIQTIFLLLTSKSFSLLN